MKNRSFLVGGALLLSALFLTSCEQIASSLDNPVPSYLALDKDSIGLSFGKTYQIKLSTINDKVAPTYQSMDERVIKVDPNGLVTAVGPGETGIVIRQAGDETNTYKSSQVDLKVTVPAPLTIHANAKGTINVYFNSFKPDAPVYYYINSYENKVAMTEDTEIEVNKGDNVYFTSANEALAPENQWGWADDGLQIQPQKSAYVYGNLMSLITPDGNYIDNKTITKPFAFYRLFEWASNLYTDGQHAIELPATTLTKGCYYRLFMGTSIYELPKLPATKLEPYCYQYMFANNWNLNQAPELPAKTLAEGCYGFMFNQCSNLYEAPVLPATKLEPYCYERMFAYCYNLSYVTCLATTMDDGNTATSDWLSQAGQYVSPKYFNKAASATWNLIGFWNTSGWDIPSVWTIQDAN